MKAWRAFVFLLLLVWSANGLSARPSKSLFVFPGYDGLGSVRYLTDATGVITDTFTYDAFGILIDRRARTSGGILTPFANPALETPPAGTTPTVNNYRYTGEQWDQDLGMYYLRARYYRPELGRFWTMDSYEGSQQDPLSLHKYLYCHANPVNNTDPSGEESLIGISIASTISVGLHGQYDAGVSVVGNSLKNTIIGVYSGASVGQIIALNFLDNAGGVIAGKLIGKLAQLRRLPGIVKGVGKVIQGDRWLRGSQGNAGFVPAQIAQRLAGRNFKNFDKFREAFWQEVAADANLSKGFSTANVSRMKEGLSPVAVTSQQVGSRISYELHHATPIQHGGDVYDMDSRDAKVSSRSARTRIPLLRTMTDAEIIELIARLQRGEGKDEEVGEWVERLKRAIPSANISDLIFYGEPSDTPEIILRKARERRPIQL